MQQLTPNQNQSDKRLLSIVLISIGIMFIAMAILFALFIQCPTNAQYFIMYELVGVGTALILAKSAKRSSLKFKEYNMTVALSGGVALPFILFYTNPVGAFKFDGCSIHFTNISVIVSEKNNNLNNILRNKGTVVMEVLGKEIRKSSINENGEAFFMNLMPEDSVRLNIDFLEPFKSLNPDSVYVIKPNQPITLAVQLYGIGYLNGTTITGDRPLSGVIVKLMTNTGLLLDTTDAHGSFEMNIPSAIQMQKYDIWSDKPGYKLNHVLAFPQTGEPLNILIEKNNE